MDENGGYEKIFKTQIAEGVHEIQKKCEKIPEMTFFKQKILFFILINRSKKFKLGIKVGKILYK